MISDLSMGQTIDSAEQRIGRGALCTRVPSHLSEGWTWVYTRLAEQRIGEAIFKETRYGHVKVKFGSGGYFDRLSSTKHCIFYRAHSRDSLAKETYILYSVE